jgi:hypothetical protein
MFKILRDKLENSSSSMQKKTPTSVADELESAA